MAKGVVEVTAPVEIEIVGDRLHATVISGERATTYAVPFRIAQSAATAAFVALGEHQAARIFQFRRKGPPETHG